MSRNHFWLHSLHYSSGLKSVGLAGIEPAALLDIWGNGCGCFDVGRGLDISLSTTTTKTCLVTIVICVRVWAYSAWISWTFEHEDIFPMRKFSVFKELLFRLNLTEKNPTKIKDHIRARDKINLRSRSCEMIWSCSWNLHQEALNLERVNQRAQRVLQDLHKLLTLQTSVLVVCQRRQRWLWSRRPSDCCRSHFERRKKTASDFRKGNRTTFAQQRQRTHLTSVMWRHFSKAEAKLAAPAEVRLAPQKLWGKGAVKTQLKISLL